ncbi:hypothetical protein [Paenarthrobacter nitroguajacolicus]|uniref:hypothetical protein n=1 Tax=Paenarthrobacter nitroguajacolicus TaxID=211146 RepID=UPI000B8333DE|nr:hypothetical protein [Paenarthrobacter nitroguajacolicus]
MALDLVGAYLVTDWHRIVSYTVQIRRAGAVIRVGRVEAATSDARMIWLASEGVDTRVLIEKAEGYEVWLEALPSDDAQFSLLQ